ncbi:MAG: diguanylate cyclase [Pyrinomonadaceae bacterium]
MSIQQSRHLVALLSNILLILILVVQVDGKYHFDSWTTDEGLPQNGVRGITQTPDGYLWFTTLDGIVRFDGVQFTTFGKGNTPGITNNRFTTIHSDDEGTIYASTVEDGILTIYKNGEWSTIPSDKVPGNFIGIIKRDEKGQTVFITDDDDRQSRSVYKLENGKFVKLSTRMKDADDPVVYRSKSGTVWTVSRDNIRQLKEGITTDYKYSVTFFGDLLEFFEDNDGALWIGGAPGVRLYQGKVEVITGNGQFGAETSTHSFWQESDGSVWFAHGGALGEGRGMVKYKNGQYEILGPELGLSNTSIETVFKDREGNIWIATGRGINRLRRDVISTLSTEDGLYGSEVYPILQTRTGKILVGTVHGLSVYENGRFRKEEVLPASQNIETRLTWNTRRISVQSLMEDSRGRIWVGVNGSIFIVEDGRAYYVQGTEGFHTFALFEADNRDVWAATDKGMFQFRNEKIVAHYNHRNGLPKEFMNVIFQDSKGTLWFGGLGGLTKFEDGRITNYTTKQGLSGDYVRSIYEDSDGYLWIGTYDEGMTRFKDGAAKKIRAADGLFSDGVFAIREDSNGYFWISSNNGIYRVQKSKLVDFAEGRITQFSSVGYGKEDGMLNRECNGGRQPATITDAEGRFWFPTQDGVAIVDPKLERFNTLAPPVVIESASIERNKVSLRNGLSLEPGERNVEISYTGVSLVKSSQIKFQYKLEGHDKTWIEAGTRRTAYYSYLAPGTYTFRVRAANSDGIWNEAGSKLTVVVKPRFYETSWFYVLSALVLVAVLFLIWRRSVSQIAARERKLARLVEEKTEELELANRELQHLANSDGLTQIGNRRRFEEFLADEWHRAIRFKTEISLVLLDIDHFKAYNDFYGHLVGDESLKLVAETLASVIHRPTDLVARFGGEEFAIVLGGTDSEGAHVIVKEAVEKVAGLRINHEASETSDVLTISVGVATTFAEMGMSETELIALADEALYKAKNSGRNRIVSFDMTLATTSSKEEPVSSE